MYSETVIDHFTNPRNLHSMKDADAMSNVGDPACGDALAMFIKVEDGVIQDISCLVFGCCASIATSSMTTVLAKWKTLDEALKITEEDIVNALGGLPENKVHCSNLGVSALRKAIENYYEVKKILSRNEILIIGTDPPCPRCGLLTNVLTKKIEEMGIYASVHHIAYTCSEAKEFAKKIGLTAGTAKDVARIAKMDMDSQTISEVIKNYTPDISCEFYKYNEYKWSKDLDKLLSQYEDKAKENGIMMTPVLIINDEIKHQGSIPEMTKIVDWLNELKA